MTKYGFSIRTRHGQKVDNIVIMAQDSARAEYRLRQMYIKCQIINRAESSFDARASRRDSKA